LSLAMWLLAVSSLPGAKARVGPKVNSIVHH